MVNIRKAVLSDTENLTGLAVRTFRETFTEHNKPEDIEAHRRNSYGSAIQSAEISDPELETLVAQEGRRSVGFAQLRWGRPPQCVRARSPGEIQRLCVDKRWHGKGLARKLMVYSLQRLGKRATDVAWLSVWETNPRAFSFYKKFGFDQVGEHLFLVGNDPQRDIVMAPHTTGSQRNG